MRSRAKVLSRRGLSRVSPTGGTPAPVTELAGGERTRRWPQVLPWHQTPFVNRPLNSGGIVGQPYLTGLWKGCVFVNSFRLGDSLLCARFL